MRSRLFFASIALSVAGCRTAVEEPNTELGLRVYAEVTPSTASVRDTAALLHLRVMVDNPSDREIRVVTGRPPYTSTRDPAQTRGLGGSVRVASATDPLNAGPNTDWWGQPVYIFPAHRGAYEETTVSLAQWRAGGWALTPGRYRVRSWFNGREGQSAMLVLTP